MNLLIDPWIPVRDGPGIKRATLGDLLCSEDRFELSFPRDDLELAALQLAVCLTQVIFPPKDAKELRRRAQEPLSREEYDKGIEPFADKFDLWHPTHPFMQAKTIQTKKKEPTSIQKLFVGLPAGHNHCFFNREDEIIHSCSACVVMALFNQASNTPNIVGGVNGPLRDNRPLTSYIFDLDLRKQIWKNILTINNIQNKLGAVIESDSYPDYQENLINQDIHAYKLTLLQGLFWQPAKIKIMQPEGTAKCDVCGMLTKHSVKYFRLQKKSYKVNGYWPHPHSSRHWDKKKNKVKFATFTDRAPAWTQLNNILLINIKSEEGDVSAPVLNQYSEVWLHEALDLSLGGYLGKRSAVTGRKHELVSLSAGWGDHVEDLTHLVDTALQIKSELRKKVYGFAKDVGISGLESLVEKEFYQQSEPIVHSYLREMDWEEFAKPIQTLANDLIKLSWRILENAVEPFLHNPAAISRLAKTKRTLAQSFNEIKRRVQT